ncbi:MAG: DMT family transporter [Rudaea sp.]|uniref:DMT family transporter n=1 Tax=unclassified Rudaea TaxID=2627037 RepID=UPI0010F5A7FA|nr:MULTISPECIES: DMT family transporter [unclassified Rudaea]MBN8888073.1 DMT family transporter [Rudaea sp.]
MSSAAATTAIDSKRTLRVAQFQIHFCVLLWGFTAILGKLISLPALALVRWRMLIVTVALLVVPKVWRGLRAITLRLFFAYALVGFFVAMHWLALYASIKLSNASVGATCIAIAPVFLAVLEPWLARRRFLWHELWIGIGVVPGVALVVGGIPDEMRMGVLVGVVSAFFCALFGALNKRLVERADPFTVTAIELGTGAAILWLIASVVPHDGSVFDLPNAQDGFFLAVLAILCTLVPFTLSLVALRHLSAFAVELAVNLEPVYAILIAIPLFGEQRDLDLSFYLGVAIIIGAVLIHPLLERRRPHKVETNVAGGVD